MTPALAVPALAAVADHLDSLETLTGRYRGQLWQLWWKIVAFRGLSAVLTEIPCLMLGIRARAFAGYIFEQPKLNVNPMRLAFYLR